MARQVRGTSLRPDVQRAVRHVFVHRYTRDHRARWACQPRPDGTPYPVQFDSDVDWLANTLFWIKADGTLDHRYDHCESNPTWPDNPELRNQLNENRRDPA